MNQRTGQNYRLPKTMIKPAISLDNLIEEAVHFCKVESVFGGRNDCV
ncbi:MAG: hypothetical protein HUU01_14415 [Saprospiraceae bacterium]|nr:hypothetical protein [Saprospiraceae bacterium]